MGPWLSIVWAIALYAVLTLMQMLLRRIRVVRQIGISLNVLFFLVAVNVALRSSALSPYVHPRLADGIDAGILCLAAYAAIRLLDVWFFDVILRRRTNRPVPVVVRDIIRWVMIAVTTFFILRLIFPDLPLNILAASSLVVGYIVGNATQDTLGNLIAGLALNTESPFSIGDWVMVNGHTGRVVEMTWRATRLQTKMIDHIVIPNSAIAREPIVNYSRPTVRHGFTLDIGVSYEVAPNAVRRVLLEVLDEVPAVLEDPRPHVWLTGYNDFSINYTIKFFITDFELLEDIQSQVMYLIWYHFKREGITIPFPIRDIRMAKDAPTQAMGPELLNEEEHRTMLRGINILRPLSDAELALVAAGLQEEIYAAGERILEQGDPGRAIYIVKSGSVRVVVKSGHDECELTRMGAGEFFGEMSLLTGECCNASVIAEADTRVLALSHEIFSRVLQSNHRLAEDLATELHARQRQHQELVAAQAADVKVEPEPLEEHSLLVKKIRRFFGLNK